MTRSKSIFSVLDNDRAGGLSATDKLVLIYLRWRQGANGESWPSLQTIAEDLHVDKRNVVRSIGRLHRAGCIRKRSGRAGRGHSNRYAVVVEKRGRGDTFSGDTKRGEVTPLSTKKRGRNGKRKVAHYPLKEQGRNHNTTVISYEWNTHTFIGITDDYLAQCRGAYPAVDVQSEIRRAALWCRNNPQKAKRRSSWGQFLSNWFSKAQKDATGGGNGKSDGDDDTLTEEELIAKARAGGSKLPWLTEEVAHV